jgi:hypothetical protein
MRKGIAARCLFLLDAGDRGSAAFSDPGQQESESGGDGGGAAQAAVSQPDGNATGLQSGFNFFVGKSAFGADDERLRPLDARAWGQFALI